MKKETIKDTILNWIISKDNIIPNILNKVSTSNINWLINNKVDSNWIICEVTNLLEFVFKWYS